MDVSLAAHPGPAFVELSPELVEAMVDHARAEYPNEMCGLIVGDRPAADGGRALRWEPARNRAASPMRYDIHPDDLYRLTVDTDDAGEVFWAIVHSHTHSPPRPSGTDIGLAFYPDALYLLVSLADPEPALAAWRIVGGRGLPGRAAGGDRRLRTTPPIRVGWSPAATTRPRARYLEWSALRPSEARLAYLRRACDLIPPGARVLELGCGAGIPMTAALADGRDVTGVDISATQIGLARANVPGATFLQADMTAVAFPPASFDAVVAFYSLTHVPRDDVPPLLGRIRELAAAGWRADRDDGRRGRPGRDRARLAGRGHVLQPLQRAAEPAARRGGGLRRRLEPRS